MSQLKGWNTVCSHCKQQRKSMLIITFTLKIKERTTYMVQSGQTVETSLHLKSFSQLYWNNCSSIIIVYLRKLQTQGVNCKLFRMLTLTFYCKCKTSHCLFDHLVQRVHFTVAESCLLTTYGCCVPTIQAPERIHVHNGLPSETLQQTTLKASVCIIAPLSLKPKR